MAKKVLNSNINNLTIIIDSLKTDYYKTNLKKKQNILTKLKELKKTWQKTHIKVRMVLKVTQIVNLFIMQNQLKVKRQKISLN